MQVLDFHEISHLARRPGAAGSLANVQNISVLYSLEEWQSYFEVRVVGVLAADDIDHTLYQLRVLFGQVSLL